MPEIGSIQIETNKFSLLCTNQTKMCGASSRKYKRKYETRIFTYSISSIVNRRCDNSQKKDIQISAKYLMWNLMDVTSSVHCACVSAHEKEMRSLSKSSLVDIIVVAAIVWAKWKFKIPCYCWLTNSTADSNQYWMLPISRKTPRSTFDANERADERIGNSIEHWLHFTWSIFQYILIHNSHKYIIIITYPIARINSNKYFTWCAGMWGRPGSLDLRSILANEKIWTRFPRKCVYCIQFAIVRLVRRPDTTMQINQNPTITNRSSEMSQKLWAFN